MPPHGAQASLYVPRREEISERAEHAHGRVESLSEVERAHVASDESDLDPRGDRLLSRPNEHRRGPIDARHIGVAGLNDEETGAPALQHPQVLEEDRLLIALGDVLIHDVDGPDPSRVRLRFRWVAEDGHEICAALRQRQQVPKRTGRHLDGRDESTGTDVRDVAHGGTAPGAEVQDGGLLSERPSTPAAFQVRGELAPVRVPASVLNGGLDWETLAVHGNAGDEVAREEPRSLRVDAVPCRRTNRHRTGQGRCCNEASATRQTDALMSRVVCAISWQESDAPSVTSPVRFGSRATARSRADSSPSPRRDASVPRAPPRLPGASAAPGHRRASRRRSGAPPRAPSRGSTRSEVARPASRPARGS